MTAGLVRLAPDVRRLRPELLLGGTPARLLRLAPSGVTALDALLGGREAPGADALERRLRAACMTLREPGDGDMRGVTVVVPVRGAAKDVQTVLDGVPDGAGVVVVDDGSDPPVVLPPRAAVVRSERSAGPAAARNRGAAEVDTPLIAFVDADIRLPPGWLSRLAGHFVDEAVVAVAPRIRSTRPPGPTGLLEDQLSALDMGPTAAEARPGSRLSYVPSAVLLVRSAAFRQAGGFDPAMRVGEDVDLVWRLSELGVVRYDPEVEVRHGARTSVRAALGRRRAYGTSAALLDVRHPGALRHLQLSTWTALPWLAVLSAQPVPAAAGVLALLVARAPGAMPALPADVARRLALDGHAATAEGVGRYAVRPGLPLVAAAALTSVRVRRTLPLLAAAYAWSIRRDLTGGPLQAGLRLLDDLAYTAGVWQGCLRARRWRPLVPAVTDWGLPGAETTGPPTDADLPQRLDRTLRAVDGSRADSRG